MNVRKEAFHHAAGVPQAIVSTPEEDINVLTFPALNTTFPKAGVSIDVDSKTNLEDAALMM